MPLYQLIIPLGILTISSLIVTVLLGVRSKILRAKHRIKIHITFAIITLLLAFIHACIVIYTNLY